MSPPPKRLFPKYEETFFLVAAIRSDRFMLRELLWHAYMYPKVIPHALLAAVLRSETFLLLLSLLMRHSTASPLSLLLPVFTRSSLLFSKTRFLRTAFRRWFYSDSLPSSHSEPRCPEVNFTYFTTTERDTYSFSYRVQDRIAPS